MGDYSRALAHALSARGHPTACAALRDHAGSGISADGREARWHDVFRQPGEARALAAWLRDFSPDWVSVQYTPYGFHPRGLGAARARRLREWLPGKARRHVMFHEIWLQPGAHGPWTWTLLGCAQRHTVRAWGGASGFAPQAVHTQARLHQARLARAHIPAEILPLFSSIAACPETKPRARSWLVEKLRANNPALPLTENPDAWWLGHFGTLHVSPDWSLVVFARQAASLAASKNRRPVFVAVGRIGQGEAAWREAAAAVPEAIFITTGKLPADEVSRALSACDAAFTATPTDIVEKSGAVVAWRAQQVPVFIPRAGATSVSALPPWPDAGLLPWPPLHGELPAERFAPPSFIHVESACDTLLAALAKATPANS